jgi:hypothetical protein
MEQARPTRKSCRKRTSAKAGLDDALGYLTPSREVLPGIYRDCELQDFTVAQLQNVCNTRQWEGYALLSKKLLVSFVCRQLSLSETALFDRQRMRVARPSVPINDLDAITQQNLQGRNPSYLFQMETKTPGIIEVVRRVHQFDPVELVRMILRTGNLTNPFNRQPFTHKQLKSLEGKYVSCLRINPDTPVQKKKILARRPDIKPSAIEDVPSRQDLNLEETDELPTVVEAFAPWLTAETLQEKAAMQKAVVSNEQRSLELQSWLVSQARDAGTALLAFLSRPSGSPSSALSANQCINIGVRMYMPMLQECIEDLAQFNIVVMWGEVKLIGLKLREVVDNPVNIYSATSAAFILGLILDCAVELLIEDRTRTGANQIIRENAPLYTEVREWSELYSSAALIRTSLQMRLVQYSSSI